MTETRTITSTTGKKIKAKYYGEKKYQTEVSNGDKRIDVKAPDLGFSAVEWLIEEIKRARKNGEDRIIILAGEVRSGKSHLGLHLASKLGLTDLDNVRYDSKTYLQLLNNSEEGDVVFLDEGGRGLYYKDAMTKGNKLINQTFQQIGAKHLVSIICLPHKNILDKELLNSRVHYWGQVRFSGYERGFVDWRLSGKKRRRMDEKKIPRHNNEWSISAYWEPLFTMRFPQFSGCEAFSEDEYERRKMQRLNEFTEDALAEMEDRETYSANDVENEKKKAKVEALIDTDLTQQEIGDKVGLSRSRVADIKAEITS